MNQFEKLKNIGVQLPIMQAGMSGASGPALAGAVSAAGGIGTLGLLDTSIWERAIQDTKARANGNPISVNLLLPYTREKHVDTVIRCQVPITTLFWGMEKSIVKKLKENDIFVFQQIGSTQEAEESLKAGVNGLIVQGVEAGGHVRAKQPLSELLAEVLALGVDVPVFAAGGICTVEDANVFMGMGAHGVCLGTRFLLTPEADIHEAYRQRLISADQTMLTTLFGFGWPDPHRVVPNKATDRWCREDGRIPIWLQLMNSAFGFTRKLVPMKSGISSKQKSSVPFFSPAILNPEMPAELADATALYAGQNIGRVNEIRPAAEIVEELSKVITAQSIGES